MFDFFKMSVPAKYMEPLLNLDIVNFSRSISKEGELITTKDGYNALRAKINDFTLVIWQHPIKPVRIELKGSFHKYFEGGSNYKDFTFSEFKYSVYQLCDLLKLSPQDCYIHLFELGVNIEPPIETKRILEGIKSLSAKKFERETFNGNGLLLAFEFTQYKVKIYDKALQFERPEPILRFELKIKRQAFLQTKGVNITTLQDLISGSFNDLLRFHLVAQWKKIILCPEGIINANLINNPRTRRNFINGLNPDYWTNLTSKAYNRQFNAFREVCREFTSIDLHSDIEQRIIQKWDQLSTDQKGINYPYVYGNIIPLSFNQPQRVCQSCGRDISNQKKGSKFCSETKYGPEVKKCRNIDSNPRNNRKRKEIRLYPGPTLFPVYIHMGIL